MKSAEMHKIQKKFKAEDPTFWIIECAAQLDAMRQAVLDLGRRMTKAGVAAAKPTQGRKYYAIEYIATYPAKLDWIGREKPKDGEYDYEITAPDLLTAEKLLLERLNGERQPKEESEHTPGDKLDTTKDNEGETAA